MSFFLDLPRFRSRRINVCVLLNSFAFDQIPLSTLLVFIFQQFLVLIRIQYKFAWHRWLHEVKYIARKRWKTGVGLVAQVGLFSDWHAEILYWRNKLLYFLWLYYVFKCFCFIYCTKRLVFSLTCRDLFVEGTDCCTLGDYIWLGNILHILFYIFVIILRENFVLWILLKWKTNLLIEGTDCATVKFDSTCIRVE